MLRAKPERAGGSAGGERKGQVGGVGDVDPAELVGSLWSVTRAGARSGRGYHYQDAVGAWLCGRALSGDLAVERIVPEGFEDLSCEGPDGYYVQVKSRQERVGDFTAATVARHLLDLAERHGRRREAGLVGQPVLVLERPVAGEVFPEWGRTVGSLPVDHPVRLALRAAGGRRGMTADQVESACQPVSLYVLPWRVAAQETRDVIVARHGLMPAAAEPVVLALRNAVAECADANASVDWRGSAGVDRTGLERITTDTIALVDRNALEEALSTGLCEPVDFDQPLQDSKFYEGVEVQPGHVAAGLPTPRPEVTGQVVAALDQGETVLVTGPSGVGKSTVMWAAAYSTRHVLWYRVRRLREGDVDVLARLARASLPSPRSPVGLVVDGVGVGATEAWDALQRRLADVPGVVLLGSARTEDLLPLRTLSNCTRIDVRLDETVAEQIHAQLLQTAGTQVPHWREAYQAADGLTLEYTHLLTRGRRLADVIAEQINRRVAERRDTELQIVARAAVAHRWGADLPLRGVQAQVGADEAAFREALGRLNVEHLIHVRGTRLTGLHQLRSTALADAVHTTPPPTLTETIVNVVDLLEDAQLQPFVVGVLTDRPDLDALLLDRLATELERRSTPEARTSILQALRLVDFHRLANHWVPVLDRHGVKPANRTLTLQLAMIGSEMPRDLLKPEIDAATTELRTLITRSFPLRDGLLSRSGALRIANTLLEHTDLATACRFLAVLAGTDLDIAAHIDQTAHQSQLAQAMAEASNKTLGNLLGAARAVSIQLALRLLDVAGGPETVFTKLRQDWPWLVEAVVVDRDEAKIAYARTLHISDQAESDVDQAARDLARVLLRCLPQCASADVQALLPGDIPVQIGEKDFGVSKLQRQYDHPPTEVAWNRIALLVATSAIAAMDPTTRADTARTIVRLVRQYLQDLTRGWCISRNRPQELAGLNRQRALLRDLADTLTLPIDPAALSTSPVDETAPTAGTDHLHTLASCVTDNLTSGLVSSDRRWSSLAAFVGDTLRDSVRKVREEERWDLLDEQPPPELDHIDRQLDDLHVVLAELAWGDLTPEKTVATARSGPYQQALERVAKQARAAATARATRLTDGFVEAAEQIGIPVQVLTRPLVDTKGVYWPPVETAFAVAVPDVASWAATLGKITELLPSQSGGRPPVLLVPFIAGRPVRHLAHQLITKLWPGHDLLDSWADQLPPPHPTPLTDAVLDACQALQGLSGLAVLATRRGTTARHQEYGEREAARFQGAFQVIAGMQPRDAVLSAIVDHLSSIADRVQAEIDTGSAAAEEDRALAVGLALGSTGTTTDDFTTHVGLTAISIQWDLDPTVAARLVDQH